MALFSSDGRLNEDEAAQLDDAKLTAAADKAEREYAEALEAHRAESYKDAHGGNRVGFKPGTDQKADLDRKATRLREIRRHLRALGELNGTRTIVKVEDNTEGSN